MLDWKKNEYKKNFISIVLLGIVLRVLLLIYMGTDGQSSWEYGVIAENIVNGKGYSFYYVEDNNLAFEYKDDAHPSPSAYMAPGYVYLLVFLKSMTSLLLENYLAFFFNLLFYIATMFYLFKVTKNLFNDKVAFIAILVYSLIPELIYTSYAIGTTQIYHLFLILIVYYSLAEPGKNKLILPFILAVALLFRFELFLLILIIFGFSLFKKNYKQAFLTIIIPTLFLSPWIIRNYQVFDEFIPFSTTGGLNLFRGNNEIIVGGWHNFSTLEQIHTFKGDTNNVELFLNRMYKKEAITYITDDYSLSSMNFAKKFLYFWFLNPIEESALSPIYFVPWLLMLTLAIMGFVKRRKIPSIIIQIIIFHSVLAIVFIPLLRYQTMMKVILLPFVAFGIFELLKKDKTN